MSNLKFKRIDHIVLTTANPVLMTEFYGKLGFHVSKDGERYVMQTPNFKINLHVVGHELEPTAENPTSGSQDFCIEIESETSFEKLINELAEKGLEVIRGPVKRHGSFGPMTSIYLRDPDKNLIELARYN